MYTNQTPPYLSTLVPPSVNTFSEYSLRNSNDTQTVHTRTTLYFNSFLPSTVREWNNLPLECRNSESVNSFKRSINESSVIVPKYYNYGKRRFQILHTRLRTNCSALNNDLFLNNLPLECRNSESVNSFKRSINESSVIVPKYYNSGKRRSQILHTRLRTNCSALNNDLFLKRICDSPYCRCGAIENAFHFFLNCPKYARQRADLIHNVSQHITISLCVLLFGDSTLSTQTNTTIFEAVHKYIRDSKRF